MIANCPTPEKLKSLSLGQLTEEQSDVLVIHLESCESCQNEIAQIDSAEDSLISQLKSSTSGEDDSFEAESGCRVAMTRALAALATVENGTPDQANPIRTTIPDKIGEYEIVRPLGHGGMGHVYLGKHTKLNRSVAIKFVADHRRWDKTMHERFESEMRLIGGLKHGNIVAAYDAREVDGIAVLVTEYIDGMTLSEILKRTGTIDVANASEIVAEVCEALQYIQSKGLVHRDIKPSNIMVDKDGNVKLLDLGLARIQHSDDTANNFTAVEFTATGQAMGTADYVSPEQINDGRNVDIRTDIYGLGCTFYKLLTGKAPFAEHPSVFSKMNAHVSEAPASLKTNKLIPAKIANLIDSMLAKEPSSRPEHPSKIAEQLSSHSAAADLKELVTTAQILPIQKPNASKFSPTKPQAKPSFFSKFPWTAVLVAATVAGLCGFLLGVTITVKKPDGATASVEIPAGSTAVVDSEGNIEIQLAGSTETARIDKANVKRSPTARENEYRTLEPSPDAMNAINIKKLEEVCEMYKLNVGSFPAKLEDLVIKPSGMTKSQWGGPYFSIPIPLDPWDRAYSYSADEENDQVEITSSLQGENTLGFQGSSLEMTFELPTGSAIYQKAERGDLLDIFLVKKNKQDDEPAYGLTSKRLVATKVKVLSVRSTGTPFSVIIRNTNGAVFNEEARWNHENLRFEFHDPNNQLVEDGLRLNGVWRSVQIPVADAGEMVDAPPTTLVFRNNELLALVDDNQRLLEIQLKLVGGRRVMEMTLDAPDVGESPTTTTPSYRFLESGQLEMIFAGNSATRLQKVQTPESKDEKTAFELLAKANSNPDYFRCYIAKPIESPTAGSHPIEGKSEHVELIGDPVINRNHVLSAKVVNDNRGKPSLSIKLTPQGAMRMKLATKKHTGEKMAMLVDGKVKIAATITSAISVHLTLTGDLTKSELDEIATALSSKLVVPKGISLSKPAVQIKSLNNLKQLMLAFHNYESAHQKFPASKMRGEKTTHPMSWRVALLPYLDQQELFDQYKSDEPWDSEANTKVLNQMPDVFRHPSSPAGTTETAYLGIAGEHGGFGIEKPKGFQNITDGTSATIFMIESKSGIPWTKPEDLLLDSLQWKSQAQFAKAFSKLEFFDPEVICVGLGDAWAMMLDREKLQAEMNPLTDVAPKWLDMLTIDDGNPVDLQHYEYQAESSKRPSKLPPGSRPMVPKVFSPQR